MSTQTALHIFDTKRNDRAGLAGTILKLYDGSLDAVVVRQAFPVDVLESVASRLQRSDAAEPWERPNSVVPSEDIWVLGTDTPATPTCKAPRGASLDAYLDGASKHVEASRVFPSTFDVAAETARLLSELADGRPVTVPASGNGRGYTPYTLRLLKEGKQISVHHDYHYKLDLYRELSPLLDTTTLISFFVTLQRPDSGGALIVYALNSDDPAQPRLANGRSDLAAIEAGYENERFELYPGDFILLTSGRRFHRVEPIVGATPRITLGGFLALDRNHERVLFWS